VSILGRLFGRSQPTAAQQAHGLPVTVKRSVSEYETADYGRLYGSWALASGYNPIAVANAWGTAVARTRHEARHNPLVRRILNLETVNIVGPNGPRFDAVPLNPDGRIDTGASEIIEANWRRWCDNPLWCDAAGRDNFTGLLHLHCLQWRRDGESFLEILPGFGYPENPYAFSVRVHNPTSVDWRLNLERTPRGNRIVNGVEVTQSGRLVGYWLITSGPVPYAAPDYLGVGGERVFVPAERMVHLMTRDVPEQTRGFPGIYAALTRLYMLGQYEKAEMEAAWDDACSLGVYHTDGLADQTDIADQMTVAGFVQDREPGSREVLPHKWKYQPSTPKRPNQAFRDFRKAILQDIAGSCLAMYNSIANDLEGVSYSSIRDGKLTERDLYMAAQQSFIANTCVRVHVEWLKMFLSAGVSALPLEKLDKFSRHKWQGKRWPWIDPSAEMQAKETARKYGWQTDESITAEMGGDYSDNVQTVRRLDPETRGTYLEVNYAAEPDNAAPQRDA